VIHLNYRPSGIVIVFPFHDSRVFTDTTAIDYLCNHPKDPQYENYLTRIQRLVRSLSEKAVNDTIICADMIPFEDTANDVYPQHWYLELTIFQLINVSKVKIMDSSGANVERIRVKYLEHPDDTETIYYNAATKKELFRRIVSKVPNLAY